MGPSAIDYQTGLIVLLAMVVTATLHEFAHAYTADRLGDETPRKLGRVSLNPLDQFDVIRGIAVIVFSFSAFGFAWGKTVPVDPTQFKNPRRDDLLVAASGLAVNLALALIFAVVMKTGYLHLPAASPWHRLIDAAFEVNIVTLLFNLVPIPPFDAGRMLGDLFAGESEKQFQQFQRQWGFPLLIATVVFGAGFIMLAADKLDTWIGGQSRQVRTPLGAPVERPPMPHATALVPTPPSELPVRTVFV